MHIAERRFDRARREAAECGERRGKEEKTRARALCSPALPYLVARSLTWVLRAAPLAQLSWAHLMRIRRNSLKHDSILSEEESRGGRKEGKKGAISLSNLNERE